MFFLDIYINVFIKWQTFFLVKDLLRYFLSQMRNFNLEKPLIFKRGPSVGSVPCPSDHLSSLVFIKQH